jgi:predicted AlkP superfamily phosphohydrolase/phosphomutase
MVGWDGATWTLLDRYMAEGRMPNLKRVIQNGVKGTLMSTFPTVTLAAWTSIFTGVNPGKHGMIDFRVRMDGKFEIIQSNFRKVESLWKILTRNGKNVIVINDPVSYPPEAINGIMTTGMLTPHNSSNFIYPPSMREEVEKVADGYVCEPSFDFFETASKDRTGAYSTLEEFADKHARVALHLAKKFEWDILAPIFTSTDRLQHFYWNEPEYIRRHYVFLDGYLGEFMEIAAKNDADLLIASDHGFGAANKALYINTWLANNGYQRAKKGVLRSTLSKSGLTIYRMAEIAAKLHLSDLAYKTFRMLPQSVKQALPLESKESVQTDYDSSKAYSITYQGIYINDKLSGEEYERVRNSLMEQLYTLKDGNIKLVERIYKKEEVVWGPCEKMAPDLVIQPVDGYCLSTHMNPVEVDRFTDRGAVLTGNHRPDGIFVAYGPDMAEGLVIDNLMHTWDVAPTVMHILGLAVPNYMDGKVLRQIFKTSSDLHKQEVISYNAETQRIKKRLDSMRTKLGK